MKRKPTEGRLARGGRDSHTTGTENTAGEKPATLGKIFLEPISDPLVFELITETTRRCRKTLLITSLICFTVTWGGLFPKEINVFGFKVSTLERTNILYVLAMVAAYYTLAFVTYSFTDSRYRKVRHRLNQLEAVQQSSEVTQRMEALAEASRVDKENPRLDSPEFLALTSISSDAELARDVQKAAMIRQVVDIYLPVIAGLGAIAVVIQEAGRWPGLPVLIVFTSIIILLGAVGVLQSEKYRTRKRLTPMRDLTSELKKWTGIKRKLLRVPPHSVRARYYTWRLKRTRFGVGSMPKTGQENHGEVHDVL